MIIMTLKNIIKNELLTPHGEYILAKNKNNISKQAVVNYFI